MINTGDIALYAPKPGTATFGQRAIQAHGSCITHGELVYVPPSGPELGGNAHIPHFELTPITDRCDAFDIGIYRLASFAEHGPADTMYYQRYQDCVGCMLLLGEKQKWPYDKKAIKWIAWNVVAKMIFGSQGNKAHVEHAVYCIESLDLIAMAAQVDLFKPIRPQKHLAPIHCDRLVSCGFWVPVADMGLHQRIVPYSHGKE